MTALDALGRKDAVTAVALVGDRDREHAAEHVNHAFLDGRLTEDEHELRAGVVQAARTREDLDDALAGIPAPGPVANEDPSRLEAPSGLLALGLGAAPLAIIGVMALIGFLLSPMFEPFEYPAKPATQVAADVKMGWQEINQVVKAERKVFKQTGRYTEDWTTLQVAMSSDGSPYVEAEVSEDRRGVILRHDGNPYGLTLTAILDGPKRTQRRCEADYPEEVRCPRKASK
jgi:hypothetical protein